jgi:hypothetical protein
MSEYIMPLQPIEGGRFIRNRIVETLLDTSTIGLNEIAVMDFSQQERMQFAQLIGYSLSGFGELSYVDDETYDTAYKVSESDINEDKARNEALRNQIDCARNGVRDAAVALFGIHPDDLE